MMSSDPTTMSEARRPTRSTKLPANGASTMEAAIMIEVTPCAVVNMWVKL